MPNVNLLPWREEQRRRRQQGFLLAVCAAALIGAFLVGAARLTVQARLAEQRVRNELLRGEIASLDSRIAEIEILEARKNNLLARIRVIVELQRSRATVVHLFDEFVRILPAGVRLVEIEQIDNRIVLEGVVESSSRVAALLRNIDASPWLRDPGLELVATAAQGPARNANFTIFAMQSQVDAGYEPPDKLRNGRPR